MAAQPAHEIGRGPSLGPGRLQALLADPRVHRSRILDSQRMLLQPSGELFRNAPAGPKLLLDVRQFAAGLLEQKLSNTVIKCGVNVDEQYCREQKNVQAIAFDQQ